MSQSRNQVHEVFPYLRVKGAEAAIQFYATVFGAAERFRLTEPSGRIGHVELDLGNIVLMLCDEFPEYDCLAPQSCRLGMRRKPVPSNTDGVSSCS